MTRALSVGVALALVIAAPAAAALFPTFDRGHARPGERVRVAAGYVGTTETARRIVLYLVPLTQVPRFGLTPTAGPAPALDGVFRLGAPRRDELGGGHLVFRVPRTARGRYTLGVYCGSCAPGGNHWASASADTAGRHTVLRVDR